MSSSGSASVPRPRAKPDKTEDPGWDYGEMVNGDKNQIKCDFCGIITKAGINRHKQHLASGYKDTKVCTKVTKDVQEKIKNYIANKKGKRVEMERIKRISATGVNVYERIPDEENEEEVVPHLVGGSNAGSTGCTSSGSASQGAKQKGPLDTLFPPKFDKLVQKPLDNVHRKKARGNACEYVADFFYENGISFNCARSLSFPRMCAAIGQFGEGMKTPSYHELRVTFLQKKVRTMKEWIDGFKVHWEYYGCSIMIDWWTDGKSRTLINFLVNCPKGTIFLKSIDGSEYVKDAKLILTMLKEVIEEVGEKNVVQVITDNASNYKLAGKWLMQKKPLFWTPCAAHCVNLMCQDIASLPKIVDVVKESKVISVFMYNHTHVLHLMRKFTGGRDLVRPAVTRFASYLSMDSIFNQKAGLRAMMNSEEWVNSKWAKHPNGKRVAKIIKRSTYWNNLHFALKILAPLVDVIRLVDAEEKPCIGYIYRAMEDCKMKLEANLGPTEKVLCQELHRIIDHRWVEQLHQPLHAAGYYLNPSIYFDASTSQSDVEANREVKAGMFKAINTLIENEDERERVINQLVMYREASGIMGEAIAIKQRKTMAPGQWWITWGSDTPDLQKFAKRVLSLTCAASPCERNWNAFNNLHSKKRNRLEHQKLNDLVYVQYNDKLKARYEYRSSLSGRDLDPIILKGLDDCQEWIEPHDAANDRVGDTDLTYGLVEEAEGEDAHIETSMRQYKRRRAGAEAAGQSQSQRRRSQLQLRDESSETEDDEEAEPGFDDGNPNDDGLPSGDDEDLDF